MSVELRDVKRRISSTRRIRQMTSAMQKVSSARLAHDRRSMEHSRHYTERIVQLLRVLCFATGDADHPFLSRRHTGRGTLVLVFGSDRGLCGGYNRALIDAFDRFRRARTETTPVTAVTVGRIPARRLNRLGVRVERTVPQPTRAARAETLDRLAADVMEGYDHRRYADVHVLYTRFATALHQVPVTERVLSVTCESAKPGPFRAALFEPAAGVILERLLPEYVRQLIDHAFLNALASEDAARQQAMARASENAGELLRDLSRRYSRLRQETITTEMLEIAGAGVNN